MSSTYSIAASEKDGKKELKFSGSLIINHIEKITAEVKQHLSPLTNISVIIDNPENIDMTFIQMLISVSNACKAQGKTFEVQTTLKDDLKLLVEKAGLVNILNNK